VNAKNGGGLRYVFATIYRGFLLGVGLCVALGGTYLVVMQIEMRRSEAAFERMDRTTENSAQDFVLSDVQELKHDGVTSIIGSVKNTGKVKARSLQIQADLFEHGKFVDQYSTYIAGSIEPGASRNFKIACGCSAPPAEHDSFKLEAIP
jgi:hypothetical protein